MDSTLTAELLNPRAQHIMCCACSLLRWGLQMYLRVLNISSSSTDPGTITITNSAPLTQTYPTPLSAWLFQNSLAERGVGGGLCCLRLVIRLIDACCSRVCILLFVGTFVGPWAPKSSQHFSPWQLRAFWMGVYVSFKHENIKFVVCEGLRRPSKGHRTVLHRGSSTPPKA